MATQNTMNQSAGVYTAASTVTATLGAVTITSGNLTLPNTTGTNVGVVKITNTVTTLIHNAGTRNIWGGPNVASNYSASGNDNAVITGCTSGGTGAFSSASTCDRNSFVGNQAAGRLLTTTSNDNSCIGFVLDTATSAVQKNTCQSATARPTGNQSIGFGFISGNTVWSGSSCIYIASTTTGSGLSESNAMRIGFYDGTTGAGRVTKCYMAGVLNATVTGNALLVNTSTGQLGGISSSQRFKNNIEDMVDVSSPLLNTRPVLFNYKHLPGEDKQFGLIAEEVVDHMPGIVGFNEDGKIHTVNYHLLPSLLLNELQKQALRINKLLARVQKITRESYGY